ncbi:MAG: thiamine ABC transporter substrate-binding protein [Micrococcales bacterium]|nr:thiamine ABC transporter substrate-binding protein [Micrococcales bacterium]
MSKHLVATAAALTTTLAVAACSVGGGSGDGSSSASTGAASESGSASPTTGGEIALVTHDSWNADKELLAAFTKQTGVTVKVAASGDAGEVTNKLVLAKDAPTGDVVFGIDNTFASRAAEAGILEPYAARLPQGADAHVLDGEAGKVLTPIDYGDVCVNVDKAWFAAKNKTAPTTLNDLVKPEYKDLFVTPGAATSSPGMAFLLATIGNYGEDGWEDYWHSLKSNGVKLTSGWTDAYSVDFSGGEGKGPRPIVLSYSTSPAFTVPEGGGGSTTEALLDTCFRQVEYAGVIKGAKNPSGAKAFIDFMLGKDFQAALPDSMYMYPVDSSAKLPAEWTKWAKTSPKPIEVSPEDIAKNRTTWLKQWADVTSG